MMMIDDVLLPIRMTVLRIWVYDGGQHHQCVVVHCAMWECKSKGLTLHFTAVHQLFEIKSILASFNILLMILCVKC